MIQRVILAIQEFLDKSLYKSEKNVFEVVLSLLRFFVQSLKIPELKVFIAEKLMSSIIRAGNYLQNSEGKIQIIQVLSVLLAAEVKPGSPQPITAPLETISVRPY